MNGKRILREVLIWVPTLLLVAMFLNAGFRKFPENGGWAWAFRNYGYPLWFRYLIGVVEVAAALMLLVPRTAAYGAATIIAVMIGAIGTVLITLDRVPMQGLVTPAICIVVASIVLAMRWSRRQLLHVAA